MPSSMLINCLLQLLFLHYFLPRASSIRTGIGFEEPQICRHTVEGRYLLSDDNGRVCEPLVVDPQSRCCPKKGDKFPCKGCSLLSNCCNSYEYCVSCCMNPSMTKVDDVTKVKIAKTLTSPTYATLFDYCEGRCRHNSASVVHENAYISDLHHCFYLPSLNDSSDNRTQPVLEGRLVGVNVVIGQLGESCDTACESNNGQLCVVNKLLVLNECDVMRKYVGCKGGCVASMGSDQPAEVVDDAPKELNPGACLYTKALSMISCDGSHPNTRRLCPCA
ncbi:SREBP regulating gene protein [Linum perenne]